jgi:hypothetical protein
MIYIKTTININAWLKFLHPKGQWPPDCYGQVSLHSSLVDSAPFCPLNLDLSINKIIYSNKKKKGEERKYWNREKKGKELRILMEGGRECIPYSEQLLHWHVCTVAMGSTSFIVWLGAPEEHHIGAQWEWGTASLVIVTRENWNTLFLCIK